jgi:hypothetical protein
METLAETTVTRRGTGFGKVESKIDCESKKSRKPKYDEPEARGEARTEAMRGRQE